VKFKIVTGILLDMRLIEEILHPAGAELVQIPLKTEEDIIAEAADADGVIVGVMEPFTRRVIRSLNRCRIISRPGVGFSNIDVEEATRQGIPVSIGLGANMHEVSDYALACILAFNRRLIPLDRAVRAGTWKGGSASMMKTRGEMHRLSQQTLGVIGAGRIGSLVAQKARAFRMRVLVYDPHLSVDAVKKLGAEKVALDHLLSESDYVSIHTPLTSETKSLLGMAELKKMKPTAHLINAARGGLVDEKALTQALAEGTLAGAALDVTDPEPPDLANPLFRLDQVLFTGHSAWFSEESIAEGFRLAGEAVVLALSGKWPPYLANPEVKARLNARIPKQEKGDSFPL
jgi:D-3-phosphoglycerate dehydrogenase